MKTPSISVSRLRELLSFDAETGTLHWRERGPKDFPNGYGRGTSAEAGCQRWNESFAGRPALNAINSGGYRGGPICGSRLKAHHVVWALNYGEWPARELDHINQCRSDNRIENLRYASRSQNGVNRSYKPKGSCKFRGVAPAPRCKDKWSARISFKKKQHFLGLFDTPEAAAKAYDLEARRLHGDFAFQNFPHE